MRYFNLFFIFIILFVGLLLWWVADSRISDFKNSHVAIADETTASIDEAITRFISERRRLTEAFSISHHEVISAIIDDPENESHHAALVKLLELFFPNYFAYTIINQAGKPLFEDFDGLIGQACIADIKKFSKTREHLPKVHPNSEMYHFDIMVPIKKNNKSYIFFLSFDADLLAGMLQNATIPNHELMLVLNQNKRKLIEVTPKGSRIHLNRDDFRMNSEEESRILRKRRIEGTSWDILDLRSKTLINNFSYQVYMMSGIIYFVFLVLSFLWFKHVRIAEKIRREADQHKAEFLSTVSHELRTPLTAIKGSIGLINGLPDDNIPAQMKQLSSIALTNTERLINIVNDLLDVEQVESGKLSLNLEKANLTGLIQQAIDSMKNYGDQFNVTYQFTDLFPDTCVNVDSNRFLQVMNNLLSNATKYGKNDDVVEVSVVSYQNRVRVSVTDNGEGIPMELQKDVFSKFAQAKNQLAKQGKVKSTGLGLHIVKKLVELMGGEINFHSSSKGTTFYIDLDICD